MDKKSTIRSDYRKLITSIKSSRSLDLTDSQWGSRYANPQEIFLQDWADVLPTSDLPDSLDSAQLSKVDAKYSLSTHSFTLCEIIGYPHGYDLSHEHFELSDPNYMRNSVFKLLDFFVLRHGGLRVDVERIGDNLSSVIELGAVMRPILEFGVHDLKVNNGLVSGEYTLRVYDIHIDHYNIMINCARPGQFNRMITEQFDDPFEFEKAQLNVIPTTWWVGRDSIVMVDSREYTLKVSKTKSNPHKKKGDEVSTADEEMTHLMDK